MKKGSARQGIEIAVEVLSGLEGPLSSDLKLTLSRLVRSLNELLSEKTEAPKDEFGIVGISKEIGEVRRLIKIACRSKIPVLITGENGTGKELIAKAIAQGTRPDRPFVAVNCGAISPGLLESELFGHVRGSFTGANTEKPGLFRDSNKGTIFLDEIGDSPLSFQVALLRVLQEGKVKPVGATKEIDVDVRVVAATNCDLEKMVKERTFREDLFYRIGAFKIVSPPLRKRTEDIPLLCSYFLSKSRALPDMFPKSFSPCATQKLIAYSWPGNIRELSNWVESISILLEDVSYITGDDFELRGEVVNERARAVEQDLVDGLDAFLESIERELLSRLLRERPAKEVAQIAKLSLSGFYNRLRTLGISLSSKDAG